MATREKRRYHCDASETQLRVMLEAREHELEAQRQRTSRTFSMILVGVVFFIVAAIWLFPTAPFVTDHAAVRIPNTARSRTATTDSTEDVRFALQLLNFANPDASSPPAPAVIAEVQSDTNSIPTTATEASIAMP